MCLGQVLTSVLLPLTPATLPLPCRWCAGLYDLRDKTLTRIFTSPYGAETTSPYWFTNFPNGWSYLGAAVQHP